MNIGSLCVATVGYEHGVVEQSKSDVPGMSVVHIYIHTADQQYSALLLDIRRCSQLAIYHRFRFGESGYVHQTRS